MLNLAPRRSVEDTTAPDSFEAVSDKLDRLARHLAAIGRRAEAAVAWDLAERLDTLADRPTPYLLALE